MTTLIGNKQVMETLRRLVVASRVPHSLLFSGPDGVGKKQFAFELARSLVCAGPQDGVGCGKCSACKRAGVFEIPRFEKGEESDMVFFSQHPDIGLVLPFKRNLRVGAIRDLEREANYLPYEASARIFIIEDADKMNDAASNRAAEDTRRTSIDVVHHSHRVACRQSFADDTFAMPGDPVRAGRSV